MALRYRQRFGKTQALVKGRWQVWSRYLFEHRLAAVKKKMMDAFRKFGIGKKQITRSVEKVIEMGSVNVESDGSYQLGSTGTRTIVKSGKRKAVFKLRLDKKQKTLEITIRGDYTYVQGV